MAAGDIVQSGASWDYAASTTVTLSSTTSGNKLIAVCLGDAAFSSLTGSGWTQRVAETTDPYCYIYERSTSGGETSITYTQDAEGDVHLAVYEVEGDASVTWDTASLSASNPDSGTGTSSSVTSDTPLSGASSLAIVGNLAWDYDYSFPLTNSFTVDHSPDTEGGDTFPYGVVGHKAITGTSAVTVGSSWDVSETYSIGLGIWNIGGAEQFVTPGLVTQSVTAFAPTVTPGAAYVTPGLVSQPVTAHNPTVTPGVAYITPGVADQTTVAYDPSVIQQQFIEPGLVQQLTTAYDPTVTPGVAYIDPGLVTQAVTSFAPQVEPGVAYIDPGLVTQSVTAHDPTVLAGEVFIGPDLATSNITAYDPTVTPGVAYVTPGLVDQSITAFDPYVYQDQFVEPGVATSTVTAHDPTVLRGTVYLEANFVQQLTVAYGPTVTPGTAYITPDPATSTVTAYDPTLYLEQLIDAGVVTQTVQGFAPLVLSTARPVATAAAGGWDTGPTGGQNLHDYTSDASDATWIEDTPA